MRHLAKLAALLLALPAVADVVTTAGTWDLYRGTSAIGRYATEAQCVAAANAINVTRTYTCRTRTTVAVTAVTVPPPPPVDTDGDGVPDSSDACPTVAASTANGCPVAPPPPPTGDARMSLTMGDTYGTLTWDGSTCAKSSSPAYDRWNNEPGDEGGFSVAPNVVTTLTLTCSNGTASVVYTPPAGTGGGDTGGGSTGGGSTGGGSTGGGDPPPPPPPTDDPVPTVLATPIAMTPTPLPADSWIRKFTETARRNWNFEGHDVPVPFDTQQGYWEYSAIPDPANPRTAAELELAACQRFYSVWLFDRPSSMLKLAMLTDDVTYRQQAVVDAQYYFRHINAAGFFECKLGEDDTKYLYPQAVLAYEQLTGDTSFRRVADRLYAQSAQGFPTTYSTSLALWTEREVGIHGSAALAYYELTGNTQALARAAAMIRQWDSMTINSDVPLVSYTQHEGGGPGGTQPTDLISSPWMSAVYFQFARRYYQLTGDVGVLHQASRYFNWLDANALYDGSLAHPELAGLTLPRYLAPSLIGDGGYDEGNMIHCPAVEGMVSFALYAKRQLGEPTARAEQRLAALDVCTARNAANWTREASWLPKYRIQNPRFFNLWAAGVYESALH